MGVESNLDRISEFVCKSSNKDRWQSDEFSNIDKSVYGDGVGRIGFYKLGAGAVGFWSVCSNVVDSVLKICGTVTAMPSARQSSEH